MQKTLNNKRLITKEDLEKRFSSLVNHKVNVLPLADSNNICNVEFKQDEVEIAHKLYYAISNLKERDFEKLEIFDSLANGNTYLAMKYNFNSF